MRHRLEILSSPRAKRGSFCFLAVLILPVFLADAPPAAAQASDKPELATHESETTVRLRTSLVLVRTVVRDSKGHPVPNLRKENFKLLDERREQAIAYFAVESSSPAPGAAPASASGAAAPAADTPGAPAAPPAPQRFLALFFDDVHSKFEDLVRSRDAADRYLAVALGPTDRAGVFTSSGQNILDFTGDRGKIHDALEALRPRPIDVQQMNACPDIDEYQADQIVNHRDEVATGVAASEILHCLFSDDQRRTPQAQEMALSEADRVLEVSDAENGYTIRGLDALVRRCTSLPGQRSIILVSSGFLAVLRQTQVFDLIDRALRANVVISALDERGLYVPEDFNDISSDKVVGPRNGQKSLLRATSSHESGDVMAELAEGTGGTFFHNSNDLEAGFRQAGAFPEVSYVLGFYPQNLKPDGRFHTLQVSLVQPAGLALQSRRGYFAPNKLLNAEEVAKEEIDEAVFSQQELNELRVAIHTQFFKPANADAQLSVLARVDVRSLRFHKEAGRNRDDLTLVAALFDRNGRFLAGKQKLVELRLRDETMDRLAQTGINMKTSFDVQPGAYLVRLVVRESEDAHMSALNQTIEIPF
jgi:VWFA-related protein